MPFRLRPCQRSIQCRQDTKSNVKIPQHNSKLRHNAAVLLSKRTSQVSGAMRLQHGSAAALCTLLAKGHGPSCLRQGCGISEYGSDPQRKSRTLNACACSGLCCRHGRPWPLLWPGFARTVRCGCHGSRQSFWSFLFHSTIRRCTKKCTVSLCKPQEFLQVLTCSGVGTADPSRGGWGRSAPCTAVSAVSEVERYDTLLARTALGGGNVRSCSSQRTASLRPARDVFACALHAVFQLLWRRA